MYCPGIGLTLSVIAMQILMSFLHFHGPSAAGFMLTATEPVERKSDHD
jgi:hypothetical protein